MIAIVDYGMGNLGSISNMLKKIGASSKVSCDAGEIADADGLILPGVGAFDNGMQNLADRGLIDILNKEVLVRKKPILGICLGMQLVTRRSEEGTLGGLGWLAAETVRFRFDGADTRLRIPHMGWNTISIVGNGPLLDSLSDDSRFYFVHSYHVKCSNQNDVLARTHHGIDFTSSFQNGNVMGVQFHPEKSRKYGMQLLKNFAEMT